MLNVIFVKKLLLQREKQPEEKLKSCKTSKWYQDSIKKPENSIKKPDKISLKSSSQIKDADWWIGSGTSLHMKPEKNSLDDYSTFEIPLSVKLAGDRVLVNMVKAM